MESGSGRKSNTCMISCFEVHLYCVLLKIKIKPHSKAQHTKDSKTVKRDVLTTVNTFVRIALQKPLHLAHRMLQQMFAIYKSLQSSIINIFHAGWGRHIFSLFNKAFTFYFNVFVHSQKC